MQFVSHPQITAFTANNQVLQDNLLLESRQTIKDTKASNLI